MLAAAFATARPVLTAALATDRPALTAAFFTAAPAAFTAFPAVLSADTAFFTKGLPAAGSGSGFTCTVSAEVKSPAVGAYQRAPIRSLPDAGSLHADW